MDVIKTLFHVLSACFQKHSLFFVLIRLLGLEGCTALTLARHRRE